MIKRFLLLIFFLTSSSTWAQDSESERLLLNKINSLEKEIQTLLSQLEEINYKLNRIEDTQQLRYVDLDKRIHELEGILLVQEEIERTNIDELDPLAGLIEEDDASNEFDLWSDSLQLIEDGRFAEASEKLRYLILSFPEGNFIGDALFWLGEIYFLQEMNEDAYETYFSLINNFPEHERVPVSLYKLGLISIKLEKNDSVMAMSILNHVEGETDEFRAYLKTSSIMRKAKDDVDEIVSDDDVNLELSTERYAELAAKEEIILTVASN